MSPAATSRRWSIGITCYPTVGGSGIIATEIGLELARRGHRVHFICSGVPHRLARWVENVYFHAVEPRDYPLLDEPHGAYPVALASKMVEVASAERLDLLHVHYAVPHATSAYLARQVLGERAPRILTTLHGTDITLVGSDPSYLPITRFSILASDAITAPSEYLRDATHEQLAVPASVPIQVVPNFVDTDEYRPGPPGTRGAVAHLFPRLAVDVERPLVLAHSSNFRALKRVDLVVRVLAEVRRHAPAVLLLVGDGPDRSAVEALARELGVAEAVCFLGAQLDVQALLARSDVFLLPSEMESFGLAALEALACGVPVVSSNVGGLPEVVDEGVTGFLCAPGDVSSMAHAVLRLARDPALRERMSHAARRDVEQRFTRGPMIDRYERVYRGVLDGKPAGAGT